MSALPLVDGEHPLDEVPQIPGCRSKDNQLDPLSYPIELREIKSFFRKFTKLLSCRAEGICILFRLGGRQGQECKVGPYIRMITVRIEVRRLEANLFRTLLLCVRKRP
jgi:hypothetical protein